MVSSQLIVEAKYEKSSTNCQPTTPSLVRPDFNYGFGRQGSCSLAIVPVHNRAGFPVQLPACWHCQSVTPINCFNVVRHSQSRSNLFDRVEDEGHTSRRPPCCLWSNPLAHTGPARSRLSKLWCRHWSGVASHYRPRSNVTFDPPHHIAFWKTNIEHDGLIGSNASQSQPGRMSKKKNGFS